MLNRHSLGQENLGSSAGCSDLAFSLSLGFLLTVGQLSGKEQWGHLGSMNQGSLGLNLSSVPYLLCGLNEMRWQKRLPGKVGELSNCYLYHGLPDAVVSCLDCGLAS